MPRLLAILILAATACGGRSAGVVGSSKPPADTTWRAAAPARVPTLDRLVATVETFASNSQDREHRELVRALYALAEAVEALVPQSSEGIAVAAGRLERSRPDAAHAELVRTALDDAIRALETRMSGRVDSATRRTFVLAVDARDRVSADTPLLRQHGHVHLALASITNAIAVAHRHPPPFDTTTMDASHQPDLGAFARHCRRAADEVSAHAVAPSWSAARARAAAALAAFGRAVGSLPATSDVGSFAMTTRYQAARLARATAIDQRGVDWMKGGLEATMGAFATAPRTPVLRQLIDDANRAVDALDAQLTFPFQRAAMQDALRTVATTCVVLAEQLRSRSDVTAPNRPGPAARRVVFR